MKKEQVNNKNRINVNHNVNRFVSILLTISFVFFTFSTTNVFATSYILDMSPTSTAMIDELESRIITQSDNSNDLETINMFENIDVFVNTVRTKYPNISDLEIAEEIMLATGDNENNVFETPNEKKLEILNCDSVTQFEQYYIESSNGGSPIQVDKKTFNKHVENVKKLQKNNYVKLDKNLFRFTSTPKTQYSVACVADDGIATGSLIVRYSAYKMDRYDDLPNRDVFVIRAYAEWKTAPFFKQDDILAISSSGNKDNRYISSALAYYYYNSVSYDTYNTYIVDENNLRDSEGGLNCVCFNNDSIYGVSVKFDLNPINNKLTGSREDFRHAYLWYGITTQNDVTCQVGYAHSTIGLNSIGASISASGISFSASIGSSYQEFKPKSFTLYYGSSQSYK